jgi:hypothetical protein
MSVNHSYVHQVWRSINECQWDARFRLTMPTIYQMAHTRQLKRGNTSSLGGSGQKGKRQFMQLVV